MNEPKHLLILTADAGFGHRSAANAVASALQEAYCGRVKVDVVNPLDDRRTPVFLRDIQSDYDRVVRQMPDLYRIGYDASDKPIPTAIVESALTVLLFDVMQDIISEYRPDAILSTYPMYQEPLFAVFSIHRYFVPLLAVVTDLVSIHKIWFNPHVDNLLVPNEMVADLAYAYHIPPQKVHITGIPVRPDFTRETRSRQEIRAELGWNPDLPTLLAVGSRRVEHLLDTIHVVNHFGAPLQLAVVAGKDQELYESLHNIEWHIPVHLYEYVDNMPRLMGASDAIICKAGGLIVTESLTAGLPMLLIDIIPGQETGNAQYVVDGGAGDIALSPLETLEVLSHWFQNGAAVLQGRAANARRLSRPHSARAVADLLWLAAQRGPLDRKGKHIFGRPDLIDLLTRNHIPWQRRLFHLLD